MEELDLQDIRLPTKNNRPPKTIHPTVATNPRRSTDNLPKANSEKIPL
jgi:hypothetical protein